jgi:hypothetical protein
MDWVLLVDVVDALTLVAPAGVTSGEKQENSLTLNCEATSNFRITPTIGTIASCSGSSMHRLTHAIRQVMKLAIATNRVRKECTAASRPSGQAQSTSVTIR